MFIIQDLPPSKEVLVLATSEVEKDSIPEEIAKLLIMEN